MLCVKFKYILMEAVRFKSDKDLETALKHQRKVSVVIIVIFMAR